MATSADPRPGCLQPLSAGSRTGELRCELLDQSASELPRVTMALGYGYAGGADQQPDLECRLKVHAAAHGLRLTHLLIDTSRSGRRGLDALVAVLSRRPTRHILVPGIADLGDHGTGWIVRRILEAEFRATVHTFDEPIEPPPIAPAD